MKCFQRSFYIGNKSKMKYLYQARRIAGLGFDATTFDPEDGLHQAALQYALNAGIRHLHHSAMEWSAMEGVANVLHGMETTGTLQADSTAHHCKVGPLRVRGAPEWPECHRVREQVYHCLHPTFLQHSILQAATTLGVQRLDTVFLDLPFFSPEAPLAPLTASAPFAATLYPRLAEAFRYLEERAAAGHIVQYGIASDGFQLVAPDGSLSGHLSLQQCLSLAAEVAGPQHHLRAIQLPLNLNEARFFLRPAPGQGEGNFVGWARQSGVAVVAERPLTTMAAGSSSAHSYADVDPPDTAGLAERFNASLNDVLHLERKARDLLRNDADAPPVHWHSFAHYLARPETPAQLSSAPAFHRMVTEAIRPMLRSLAEKVKSKSRPELTEWLTLYRGGVEQLCRIYSDILQQRTHDYNAKLNAVINDCCPDLRSSPLLPQKALRVALHSGADAVACAFASPLQYKALLPFHAALAEPVDPRQLRALLADPRVKYAAGAV